MVTRHKLHLKEAAHVFELLLSYPIGALLRPDV